MTRSNTAAKWLRDAASGQIRAVIYVRVSHDPNGTGRSVKEQEVECRKVVQREGWTLVFVYCDEDRSASEDTKDRREAWEQLNRELVAGQFDVLVVWEPSRATRDRQAWAALAYACEQTGTRICANGRVYDLDDPDDAFALDLFFALARRESKVTKKRVARTVDSRASDGLPGPGKAPYGYRRVYDQATGAVINFEPDDKERIAESPDGATTTIYRPDLIVRQMFKDALEGVTAYATAERLNRIGIPNPRTLHAVEHHKDRERKYGSAWNPNMIRNLLANPAYLGLRSHRGKLISKPKWKPLVDKETFYAIANRAANAKFPGPRPARSRHLLSRLGICGECGLPIQATTDPSGAYGYRCRTGRAYIARDLLDHFVTRWIVEWLSSEDNLNRLRDTPEVSEQIAQARADVEMHTAELARVKTAFQADSIDLDDYSARRATLLQRVDEAERRAAQSGIPPLLRAVAGADLAREFVKLDLSTKREIIRFLVEVRLLPNGKGRHVLPVEQRVQILPRLI